MLRPASTKTDVDLSLATAASFVSVGDAEGINSLVASRGALAAG
jgi:hypothetical protein